MLCSIHLNYKKTSFVVVSSHAATNSIYTSCDAGVIATPTYWRSCGRSYARIPYMQITRSCEAWWDSSAQAEFFSSFGYSQSLQEEKSPLCTCGLERANCSWAFSTTGQSVLLHVRLGTFREDPTTLDFFNIVSTFTSFDGRLNNEKKVYQHFVYIKFI